MKNTLLRFLIRRFFTQQSFADADCRETAENMREVVQVLLCGADAFLSAPRSVVDESHAIPWDRKEFFWEGVAFGQAASHAFSFCCGNPDRLRTTDGYRLMHYTGYGFWAGIARIYPIPTVSVSLADWADVDDFRRYAPLLAGGLAFGIVCARKCFDRRTLDRLILSDPWRLAAIHGCGRALWFLFPGDVLRLQEIVALHSDLREALLEGIGIAIAFTCMRHPGRISASLEGFDLENRPAVIRGAAVAIAETEDESSVRRWVEPELPAELKVHVDACRRFSQANSAPDSDYYCTYVQKLRGLTTTTRIEPRSMLPYSSEQRAILPHSKG